MIVDLMPTIIKHGLVENIRKPSIWFDDWPPWNKSLFNEGMQPIAISLPEVRDPNDHVCPGCFLHKVVSQVILVGLYTPFTNSLYL